MKRAMISVLILAVLSFWTPCASAEISQDLDPMVSPDAQTTMTNEGTVNNFESAPVSNAVSVASTATPEKKVEEPKKKKTKKTPAKKSSTKKSSKSSSKKSKTSHQSSY